MWLPPAAVRGAAPLFLVAAVAAVSHGEITGVVNVGSLPGVSPSAVFATHAPGRPNDLFVLDQQGLIQVLQLDSGQWNRAAFLDIRSLVDDTRNEQGLLGLAFDPDFANNGYFYVNYTHDPGPGLDTTRVDRYQVANPLTDTSTSSVTRHPILEFDQDDWNHNGGWMGFSPNDGYLYISTGDGGGGNDLNNRAQNLNTRLGKMLRIDVDGDDFPGDANENYSVPADNPFVGVSGLDEIWSYGLRNPWRASFDRLTGDLWIGDVGQGAREEIDFQDADSSGGENYGWRLREGDIATPGVGGPEPADHVGPVYDYLSDGVGLFGGNSVVGGYVYRGPDPDVQGRYFFGDSFPDQLWTFDPADPNGTVQNIESTIDPQGQISVPVSYGEDVHGNLYIVDRFNGVFRIVTDALIPGDYNADGVVDQQDYDVWSSAYGTTASEADGNNNGLVDAADYTIWRDNLGSSAQDAVPSEATPEPSCLALLLLGALSRCGRSTNR